MDITTLDEVLALALKLAPAERLRLIEKVASSVEREFATDASEEEADFDPVEAFTEGWQDILAGRTYPAESLWEDLDDE